jgi:hypothetical protein
MSIAIPARRSKKADNPWRISLDTDSLVNLICHMCYEALIHTGISPKQITASLDSHEQTGIEAVAYQIATLAHRCRPNQGMQPAVQHTFNDLLMDRHLTARKRKALVKAWLRTLGYSV